MLMSASTARQQVPRPGEKRHWLERDDQTGTRESRPRASRYLDTVTDGEADQAPKTRLRLRSPSRRTRGPVRTRLPGFIRRPHRHRRREELADHGAVLPTGAQGARGTNPNRQIRPDRRLASRPDVPPVSVRQNCTVTGGMGFVGRRLVEMLVERGATRVVAFDIAPKPEDAGDDPRIVWMQGDLTNPATWTRRARAASACGTSRRSSGPITRSTCT